VTPLQVTLFELLEHWLFVPLHETVVPELQTFETVQSSHDFVNPLQVTPFELTKHWLFVPLHETVVPELQTFETVQSLIACSASPIANDGSISSLSSTSSPGV